MGKTERERKEEGKDEVRKYVSVPLSPRLGLNDGKVAQCFSHDP